MALGTLRVKMLPGEKWWGLCNAFGREMPFTEATAFECDLRVENYGHQSLSLLCSDRGRAIWCPEPVGAKIAGGEIALESDAGPIALVEDAGRNLAEAFRFASRTWFPPTGGEPELLYFSAPQLNTWIELTYHQNQKDILAYARSMLDHGVPPGVLMIDDTWQAGYGDWRAGDTFLVYPGGQPSWRFLELRNGIVAAEKARILRGSDAAGFAKAAAAFDLKKALDGKAEWWRVRRQVLDFVNAE